MNFTPLKNVNVIRVTTKSTLRDNNKGTLLPQIEWIRLFLYTFFDFDSSECRFEKKLKPRFKINCAG